MKQETYVKAHLLNKEIDVLKNIIEELKKAQNIIEELKKAQGLYIGSNRWGVPRNYNISEELRKRILPICEEYLKELEKEFEEL